MKRRRFLGTLAAASVASAAASGQSKGNETVEWDYIIIGAGTAGLPAAIFASGRGARVLLIDAADSV